MPVVTQAYASYTMGSPQMSPFLSEFSLTPIFNVVVYCDVSFYFQVLMWPIFPPVGG